MSQMFASPLAATDVCVRVLRRLLDDEVEKFAQFSYVVENIHNPIIDNCGARHTRRGSAMPFPSATPEDMELGKSIVSDYLIGKANASGSDGNHTAGEAKGGANASADFSDAKKLLPVQPVVVAQARSRSSGAAVAAAAAADISKGHANHNSKHVGAAAAAHNVTANKAKGKHGTTHSPAAVPAQKGARAVATTGATNAPQPILTWSHYWELFANTSTLYAAHAALIRRLKHALLKLTAQLDQLQREEEEADGLLDATTTCSTSAVLQPPQAAAAATTATTTAPSSLPPVSSKAAPAPLRTPQSSVTPLAENANPSYTSTDAYKEVKQIVLGFFQSPEMQHYTVEYMMYTNNYARSIAPRILELARLWRWSVGAVAAPGRGAASPSVALAQLTPTDRGTLLQFSPFLDFLFRSFGDQGVPADVRVNLTEMPEQRKAAAAMQGGGGNAGAAAGAKRSHAQGKAGNNNNNVGPRAAAQLPAMPSDWDGFFTYMMLMATPLADLRRYTHVARCLLSACVFAPADRLTLYQDFLAPAVQRLGDATAVVMEDLAQHDVASILALMEDSSSMTMGDASTEESIAAWNKYRLAPCDDRVLVHYGRVEKRFRRGKHTRLLFLFSDALCYVDELSTGRLRPRGFMPLDTVRVVSVADLPSSDIQDCFEIITSQTKRFIFFTSSPEQKRQWIDAIRYAVKQRNRVRASGANAARGHARRFLYQVTNYTNIQAHRPAEEDKATTGTTAAAAAASSGLDDLLRQMRSTAPTLPYRSRLSRQRQYDQEWQRFVDLQRKLAVPEPSVVATSASATTAPPPLAPTLSSPNAELQPLHAQQSSATTAAALSANGSFALSVGRSSTTHRQLEYDVTPWGRQSSMRRLQNQELSVERAASTATPVGSNAPGESPKPQSSLPAYPRRQQSSVCELAAGSSRADNTSNSSRQAAATPLHRLVSERFDSARVTPHSSRQGSSDVADKTSATRLQVSAAAGAAATKEGADGESHIHIDDEDFAGLRSNFSRSSSSSSSGSSGDVGSTGDIVADVRPTRQDTSKPIEEEKTAHSNSDLQITFSVDESKLSQLRLEPSDAQQPSTSGGGPTTTKDATAPPSTINANVKQQLLVEEEDEEEEDQTTSVTVTAFRRPNTSQNILLASTPISASSFLRSSLSADKKQQRQENTTKGNPADADPTKDAAAAEEEEPNSNSDMNLPRSRSSIMRNEEGLLLSPTLHDEDDDDEDEHNDNNGGAEHHHHHHQTHFPDASNDDASKDEADARQLVLEEEKEKTTPLTAETPDEEEETKSPLQKKEEEEKNNSPKGEDGDDKGVLAT